MNGLALNPASADLDRDRALQGATDTMKRSPLVDCSRMPRIPRSRPLLNFCAASYLQIEPRLRARAGSLDDAPLVLDRGRPPERGAASADDADDAHRVQDEADRITVIRETAAADLRRSARPAATRTVQRYEDLIARCQSWRAMPNSTRARTYRGVPALPRVSHGPRSIIASYESYSLARLICLDTFKKRLPGKLPPLSLKDTVFAICKSLINKDDSLKHKRLSYLQAATQHLSGTC